MENNPDIDVELIRKHYCDIAIRLTEEFSIRGIPVTCMVNSLSSASIISKKAAASLSAALKEKGSISGMMHASTISNIADITSELYARPVRPLVHYLPTQSGKGTVQTAVPFVSVALKCATGKDVHDLCLSTGRKGQNKEAELDFESFTDLYGDVLTFSGPFSASTTISAYRNHIFRKVHADSTEIKMLQLFARTNNRATIEHLNWLTRKASEAGLFLVISIDEGQYGGASSLDKSVIAKMLKETGLLDLNTHGQHVYIVFSATPYHHTSLADTVTTVYGQLGENYSGLIWFKGTRIDPSGTARQMDVLSFDQMASRDPAFLDLPHVAPALYRKEASFRKYIKKHPRWKTHEEYREFCEKSLARAINRFLIDNPDKRGRGLCLRLVNSNTDLDAFLMRLSEAGLSPDIQLLAFTGDNATETIAETIASRFGNGRPYLIAVTGAGRMADRFPKSCAYYLDFTQKCSTQAAMLQGLIGRGSGYGKNSLVIVSRKVKQRVDQFMQAQGDLVMKAIGGTAQGRSQAATPRTVRHLTIRREDAVGDSILQNVFASLSKELEQDLLKPSLRTTSAREIAVWDILSEGVLRHIEGRSRVLMPDLEAQPALLRPGCKGAAMESSSEIFYDVSGPEGRTGRVALRNIDAVAEYPRPSRGRIKGLRDTSGVVQPFLRVKKVERSGRWEVREIVLLFADNARLRSQTGRVVALPLPNTVWSGQLSPDMTIARDNLLVQTRRAARRLMPT
jgi:hypothetical protein